MMEPKNNDESRIDEITRIEAAIQTGEENNALEKLRAMRTENIRDAALHRRLGHIAEMLGDTARAITEYNLSLRENKAQPDVILKLARIRMDRGEMDRAIRAYRHYFKLKPESPEIKKELMDFLNICGRPDLALQFKPATLREPDRADTGIGADDTGISIDPNDSDCVMFASRFAGREGVHARQWVSPTGNGGYSPIKAPFTPAVARQHLLGTYTVGLYPVRMDNTVMFMAWDIDISRKHLSSRGFGSVLKATHDTARRLIDIAASLDLPTLLEDSGHKGRHVWIIFHHPVPAAAARRLGEYFIERMGSKKLDVSIEVFPKQSRVSSKGLGNLIKLPLGIHRVTGRRSLFLDPASGAPLTDQLSALHAYPRLSRSHVLNILEQINPYSPQSFKHTPAPERPDTPQIDTPDIPWPRDGEPLDVEPEMLDTDNPAVTEIKERIPEKPPFILNEDMEYLTLLNHCPVIAEIVRKIETNGVVSTNERIVLTHALGHLSHGPEIVNTLLSKTLTVSQDAFLKSRLRGNPISCPRIRQRLRDLTASVVCNCRFDPDTGMYPSPLLHLSRIQHTGNTTQQTRISQLTIDRMIMDFIRARARAESARRLAREIENEVLAMMKDLGIDRINTSTGTVVVENGSLSIDFSGTKNAFDTQPPRLKTSDDASSDIASKENEP